jgi:hypothetical protein
MHIISYLTYNDITGNQENEYYASADLSRKSFF